MPYAILRFEKRKGGPASALEKHHERKKERYASNPDIDSSRSHLNYHLVEPRLKYYGEIQTRIEKAQRENPKCKARFPAFVWEGCTGCPRSPSSTTCAAKKRLEKFVRPR